MIPIQMFAIKGLTILIIAWAISSSTILTFYTAVIWCSAMWIYKNKRPHKSAELILVVVISFVSLLWWYSLF